jgi:archaellum biogenesis ATPase FlaH
LAASVRDRSVWEAFDSSGEAAKVPEDFVPVVDYVRDYYTRDPKAAHVLRGTIALALADTIRDPKRRQAMHELLNTIYDAKPSIENAKAAIRTVRTHRVAESLATKLLIPSKDGEAEIAALMDEYVALKAHGAQGDDAPAWSAETLAPALGEPRIPIYPASLGRRLRGGLWPGHHMTVFARPEVGKSAFAINAAVMAASRGGANVLYLSNEDPVRDLMVRALVRFCNLSHEGVLKNLEAAVGTARGYGADRITFRDMAPGTLYEIDRLVRRYKPDLLIVDQMRNVGSGKPTDNMTQRLDNVSQGLRSIGKRHGCAVLSVTQAGDSARDKAILDDGDVDSSNTGVSAGCDVLIGIGATPVMMEAGERRLSIIKNKLGGQHGFADVRLDPLTLAFRD